MNRYARYEAWQRAQAPQALKMLDLEIGARVWYWCHFFRQPARWVRAEVTGASAKDGYPVVSVRILEDVDTAKHKWGYGWQIAQGEERPPAPDLSQTYP